MKVWRNGLKFKLWSFHIYISFKKYLGSKDLKTSCILAHPKKHLFLWWRFQNIFSKYLGGIALLSYSDKEKETMISSPPVFDFKKWKHQLKLSIANIFKTFGVVKMYVIQNLRLFISSFQTSAEEVQNVKFSLLHFPQSIIPD